MQLGRMSFSQHAPVRGGILKGPNMTTQQVIEAVRPCPLAEYAAWLSPGDVITLADGRRMTVRIPGPHYDRSRPDFVGVDGVTLDGEPAGMAVWVASIVSVRRA